MSVPAETFKALVAGELSAAALTEALEIILRGDSNDAQVAALLLGLEMKGVTAQDIRIGTAVMRSAMTRVSIPHDVIDIVGTGGTGLHTLSISTASALVCAGAGAKVAKHGNRAASSLTGTADTLSELGVNLSMSPERAAQCVDQAGVGFLFAPNHHPAMRHVGPARKALGIRTLFNLLGPMCNPAGAKRMLLGVSDNRFRRPIAEALLDLGAVHIWVVHGHDGLDEITTTSVTSVSEVKNGRVTDFEIAPQSYGIELTALSELRGGKPEQNAAALTALLNAEHSAYRDIVRLNAGVALMIAGIASDIPDGIDRATASIDSFAARSALAKLTEVSNG